MKKFHRGDKIKYINSSSRSFGRTGHIGLTSSDIKGLLPDNLVTIIWDEDEKENSCNPFPIVDIDDMILLPPEKEEIKNIKEYVQEELSF